MISASALIRFLPGLDGFILCICLVKYYRLSLDKGKLEFLRDQKLEGNWGLAENGKIGIFTTVIMNLNIS